MPASASPAARLLALLLLLATPAALPGCARSSGRAAGSASAPPRIIPADASASGGMRAARRPAGASAGNADAEPRLKRPRSARSLAPAPEDGIAWPEDLFALSPHAHLLALPARPRMLPPPRPAGRAASERAANAGKVPPGSRPVGRTPFSPEHWRGIAREAEEIFGVDAGLVLAVIRAESDFDAACVSHAGAEGAMQIMPATGEELGLIDPFDPRANVYAGTRHLMEQLRRFGSTELALAAYNAGPGAVMRHGGIPPFKETREYVRRVMNYWKEAP